MSGNESVNRTRYTNLMSGNESVNKMINKNATASTITVQMYRVNKSNNERRCTWTSEENHCAPTFRTDKLLFYKDKQQN